VREGRGLLVVSNAPALPMSVDLDARVERARAVGRLLPYVCLRLGGIALSTLIFSGLDGPAPAARAESVG